MKVKFWGTRGSIAVTGANNLKYGGNTPCVEISLDNNLVIILDAGSGIRELGQDLIRRNSQKNVFIFFSHFHTDHIVGLPFFAPFYNSEFNVEIFGKPYIYKSIENIIDLILRPPLFSITKSEFKSKYKFHNIDEEFLFENKNLKIEAVGLNHPNPTLGFKITHKGKSVVYFTDNELTQNNHSTNNLRELILSSHEKLISFCKNTDLLIHDSSYSVNDYNTRIGWGHSSNLAAAMFAHLAEVKSLFLFHYDPEYTDADIDKLLIETQEYLKEIGSKVDCFASRDLLEITL